MKTPRRLIYASYKAVGKESVEYVYRAIRKTVTAKQKDKKHFAFTLERAIKTTVLIKILTALYN